jgi:hypothetical protein
MADLSLSAQAVWTAYLEQSEIDETPADLPALAAALRAAADQVVPEDMPEMHSCCHELIESIHSELLAIAVELECAND